MADQTVWSLGPGHGSSSPGTSRYSCARCSSRKVKCDKLLPKCTKCSKGDARCEYREPQPARRGKRKLEESDLHARLRHMEGLMRKNGLEVPPEPRPNLNDSPYGPSSGDQNGDYLSPNDGAVAKRQRSVDDRERSRYRGSTHNPLWQDLEDLHATSQGQGSSDDEEERAERRSYSHPAAAPYSNDLRSLDPFPNSSDGLILGVTGGSTDQSLILPTPESCSRLWQIYQENFNPLTHVVHVPTTDPLMLEAMSNTQDLAPSERALVFAIFAASVSTLSNGDCRQLFSQPKDALLERYRLATKQALVKAKLLSTSNMQVLQAFIVYLISCHQSHSAEAAWILSGVAIRIGLRLGIQRRDLADLSPFEAELRTRLWWQICVYDTQLSEVAGQRAMHIDLLGDLDMPLNVDDSVLSPDMPLRPEDHEGATEMMFSRVRYEFGTFLRNGGLEKFFRDSPIELEDMRAAMAEKDKTIDGLEKVFESRYLRYCDPLVPLQFLSTILARCIIARLRLMAHHPRQYTDKGASLPTSEKDMLFTLSLKALEYDTIVESTPTLRGFRWHTQNQVQWLALVHVLSDLRKRTAGLDSDKAWRQVESIYRNHPQMKEIRKRPIFKALATLVISAWKAREAEHQRRYGTELVPLPFVSELMERRQAHKALVPKRESLSVASPHGAATFSPMTDEGHEGMSSLDDLLSGCDSLQDFSPVDWAQWDDLVRDFEVNTQQGLFQ